MDINQCDDFEDISDYEWKEILSKLYKFTNWKCTILPADLEPEDIAHEALKRILQKSRKWNKDTCPELLKLLIDTVDSILYKLWKLNSNKFRMREKKNYTNLDELDKYAANATENDKEKLYEDRLKELQLLVKGDNDLEDFLLAIECGNKTFDDIAKALEWELTKVYQVKRRLKEKLERKRKEKQVE